jgi:uncharacterized repeat protein (TIGR03803 family)
MKSRILPTLAGALLLAAGAGDSAWSATRSAPARAVESVLFSFSPGDSGTFPVGVVFDSAGNLYGATNRGGEPGCPSGCGVVYKLTPPPGGGNTWTETVLHSFGAAANDGIFPGALIIDPAGNLFGVTPLTLVGPSTGTIFELSPVSGGWTYQIIHGFRTTGVGGWYPDGLVMGADGNLYGTTGQGGSRGYGTVFELTRGTNGRWTEKLLYSFRGGNDGRGPGGLLTLDASGNLYGTTWYGGGATSCGDGCGVVFQVNPSTRDERVLHRFQRHDPKDGIGPSGVVFDTSGRLYGSTGYGGARGAGTIYELAPAPGGRWTERVLYSFSGGRRGAYAGVVSDRSGDLYGTAADGGDMYDCGFAGVGCGVAFKFARGPGERWRYTVVHRFAGGLDGSGPDSNLIFDRAGNLYGTTELGGASRQGTVFEIALGS